MLGERESRTSIGQQVDDRRDIFSLKGEELVEELKRQRESINRMDERVRPKNLPFSHSF